MREQVERSVSIIALIERHSELPQRKGSVAFRVQNDVATSLPLDFSGERQQTTERVGIASDTIHASSSY